MSNNNVVPPHQGPAAEPDEEALERIARLKAESERLEKNITEILALADGPKAELEAALRRILRIAQDRIDLARGAAAHKAWMDMTGKFSYAQRKHLANLLAHDWTITSISIESKYGGTNVIDAAPSTAPAEHRLAPEGSQL